MTDESDFLQRIVSQPDDDGPRLVYADWLEDHGQAERAEFIRVQCQLAQIHGTLWGRLAPQTLERYLLTKHEPLWAAGLDRVLTHWTFVRGFLEAATADTKRLLQNGPAVFAAAPLLRRLTLINVRGLMPELTRAEWLARLTLLNLEANHLGDISVGLLATSSFLQELQELDLSHNRITDQGVYRILEVSRWTKLRKLRLFGNMISPEGERALIDRFGRAAVQV